MGRELTLTRRSKQKQTLAQDTRANDTLTATSVQRECTKTRTIQRPKIPRAPNYSSILETLNPHEPDGIQHPILPHPQVLSELVPINIAMPKLWEYNTTSTPPLLCFVLKTCLSHILRGSTSAGLSSSKLCFRTALSSKWASGSQVASSSG